METQMVLSQFTQLMAFGYMFFAGFVLIFMLIQIFAFYLSGRATGSIDDEVGSAFTLFGAMLVIGAASTLLNAMIAAFLSDMLIAGGVAFLAYVIAIIYAVVRIYELSIGKAILFLLLSMVITIVLTGGIIYAAIMFIPKEDKPVDTDPEDGAGIEIEMEMEIEEETPDGGMEVTGSVEAESSGALMGDEIEDSVMEAEENLNEAMDEVEEAIDGEEGESSGPGAPGSTP